MGEAIAPAVVTGAFTAGVAVVAIAGTLLTRHLDQTARRREWLAAQRLAAAADLRATGTSLVNQHFRREDSPEWRSRHDEAQDKFNEASARFLLLQPNLIPAYRDLLAVILEAKVMPDVSDPDARRQMGARFDSAANVIEAGMRTELGLSDT
jgi:hypothetical protein